MPLTITSQKKNKGAASGATKHGKASDPDVVSLLFTNEGDHLYGIYGVDSVNNQVELGDITTMVLSTSNAAIVNGQIVSAHMFKAIPIGAGTANLVVKVTFKTGANGLQTVTIPFTVTGNPAIGLVATEGTPTVS